MSMRTGSCLSLSGGMGWRGLDGEEDLERRDEIGGWLLWSMGFSRSFRRGEKARGARHTVRSTRRILASYLYIIASLYSLHQY